MFGLRYTSTRATAGQAALLLVVGLVFALVIGIAKPAHGHCLPEIPNAPATASSEIGQAPAPERAPMHFHHIATHCHVAGGSAGVALPSEWLDLSFPIADAVAIAYMPRRAPAQHVLPDLKPPIG